MSMDLREYLANGGDFEAALASAVPMVPLIDRKADELTRAREALRVAMVALGAEQVTRDERRAVAKALSAAVPDLAWLAVLDGAAWTSACAAMQACGGFAGDLTALRRAVKTAAEEPARVRRDEERALRSAGAGGESVLEVVLGALAKSAELPPGLRVPRPYLVTQDGTFLVREKKDGETEQTRVCQRPIFIVGLGVDLEDDTQSVTVRWYEPPKQDGGVGAWRSRVLPRKTVCVARALADESDHGVPATSENAKSLVAYFDAFLGENESRLPRRLTTRTLGWKKGGFLWGTEFIGRDGPVTDAAVALSQLEPGVAQAVKGYRQAGSFENWCAAVRGVAHLPRVMLSLYAAMAPPLIHLLRGAVGNGIIDWAGETSGGKTSTLRVGASVWGLPDDSGEGIIRPWESSGVYIERMAALCNDIPVFLDDTKRVRKKEEIGKVLYMVAQGQGRGRGTLQSLATTSTWRTFLQSTGEAPATSYAQEGGAAARCLTVWGPPFDSAEAAESTKYALLRNYGHLGPRMVAWLQQEGQVARVRERFAEHTKMAVQLGDGNVVRRMSSTVALLSLCAEIAEALGVPAATVSPAEILTESVSEAARESDKASEALIAVHGWAVSNATSFFGRHIVFERWDGQEKVQETRIPNQGWLGQWRSGEWDVVGFMPDPLRRFLTDRGFDAGAILRTWRGRGWLLTGKAKSYTRTMVMPGRDRPQGVVVRREAFEAASGEDVAGGVNPDQVPMSHLFEPHGDAIVDGVT
jgi:uncharacterized protein (DUF927 family)